MPASGELLPFETRRANGKNWPVYGRSCLLFEWPASFIVIYSPGIKHQFSKAGYDNRFGSAEFIQRPACDVGDQ
jgi:hypothetical protein